MSRAGNLRMRTGLQTSVRFGGREGKEDTHARENVAKSLNGFVTIPEGSKHDLSLEVVHQLLDNLGLMNHRDDFGESHGGHVPRSPCSLQQPDA